jgi:predicted transcriptional regulator
MGNSISETEAPRVISDIHKAEETKVTPSEMPKTKTEKVNEVPIGQKVNTVKV